MSADATLPTLDKLNATVPADLDAKKVAQEWFAAFAAAAEKGDVDAVMGLFLPGEVYWRDLLTLTWDFRTFGGADKIRKFLQDRLAGAHLTAFKLRDDYLQLQQPYPDLAWIQAFFDFETDFGLCSGIVRLVPTANGEWKAHHIFTNLEDLKGFPEKIGWLRNQNPNHGLWEAERRREVEFADSEPVVLIAGAGQSGLDLAARLKTLGVPTLVIERNKRIGDNWRGRYEALCLHDPVWYDHLPYIPFPATWPVYTPALKLANWLESYAESMELNVWTSSTVVSAKQDASNFWDVLVRRADGRERVFHVKNLVFAAGIGSGDPKMPEYPGMDKFKGQILHSTQHKKATDHAGKKVVVVGACTAGHDIAVDYVNHGVDVTMFQRSSTHIMSTTAGWKVLMTGVYAEDAPPVEIGDRVNASFSNLMRVPIAQRQTLTLEEMDKEIIDGLHKVGFRTNRGYKDTGFFLLAWDRAGGYYLDTGGSQYIIDGRIKLKNDSQIKEFTEHGLKFENGSEVPADVVLFATGLGDARGVVKRVCGDEVAVKCGLIWGLDDEAEINGAWRDLGLPGLWYMMGNLALCRFYSKHLALQIKAAEEGIFNGKRYSK